MAEDPEPATTMPFFWYPLTVTLVIVAEPVVVGLVVPRGWPTRMPSPFWSPLRGLSRMSMTEALERFSVAPPSTAIPVSMLSFSARAGPGDRQGRHRDRRPVVDLDQILFPVAIRGEGGGRGVDGRGPSSAPVKVKDLPIVT